MTTTPVFLAKAGPGYGVGVYRDLTEWTAGTPGWQQSFGELFTEGGLLLFVVILAYQWWHARKGDDRTMAYALLAPSPWPLSTSSARSSRSGCTRNGPVATSPECGLSPNARPPATGLPQQPPGDRRRLSGRPARHLAPSGHTAAAGGVPGRFPGSM